MCGPNLPIYLACAIRTCFTVPFLAEHVDALDFDIAYHAYPKRGYVQRKSCLVVSVPKSERISPSISKKECLILTKNNNDVSSLDVKLGNWDTFNSKNDRLNYFLLQLLD